MDFHLREANVHMKPIWIMGLFLLSFTPSTAQRIVKIVDNYVLIDSLWSTWQVGDEVQIKRRGDQEVFTVGTVRLLRFKQKKVAGRIVNRVQPFHIRIGDFVRSHRTSKNDAGDAEAFNQNRRYSIIKIISDYVLIDADSKIGEINEIVRVHRKTKQGFVDVGRVKLFRFRDGKTAARIVREAERFQIQIGDVVFVREPELDIDTYFFGSFRQR